MYLEHFGLNETPFSLTPDTGYFLNRAGYRDALNVLLVALRSGEGFLVVEGEVGTGKTLLCRQLINTLDDHFATAYVHNPYLTPLGLLQNIADELPVAIRTSSDQQRLLKRLTSVLLRLNKKGRPVVVCLDEAQAMPTETLEVLRLLTNLETEKRKLVQVVLFGQPEINDRLAQPSLRQLRQRIGFSVHIDPMSPTGMQAYVAYRLAVAGHRGQPLFDARAMALLHQGSRGIPRLVNSLCHKAMLSAFGQGRHRITAADVRSAVDDTLDASLSWRIRGAERTAEHSRRLYSALGLVIMFGIGALWGQLP